MIENHKTSHNYVPHVAQWYVSIAAHTGTEDRPFSIDQVDIFSIIISIMEKLVAVVTTVWDQCVPKDSHSKWMLLVKLVEWPYRSA